MANLVKICKKIRIKIIYKVRRLIKSFTAIPARIMYICEYIPLLWHDRHWDYRSIFDLLDFKLRKMEETIRKNNLIQDVDIVCKRIRVCRKLLKRSQDEDWHYTIQMKPVELKWGEPIFWSPCTLTHGKDHAHKLLIGPSKALRQGKIKEYNQEYVKALRKINRKRDRDLRVGLKIFQKYCETWWD